MKMFIDLPDSKNTAEHFEILNCIRQVFQNKFLEINLVDVTEIPICH